MCESYMRAQMERPHQPSVGGESSFHGKTLTTPPPGARVFHLLCCIHPPSTGLCGVTCVLLIMQIGARATVLYV